MALVSLRVRGFRVIRESRFEFEPGGNYLFGPNGSGKTSVLEAVHYSATGRSFRTRRDRDLLRFGAELLSVTAEDERGRVGQLEFDGRQKRFELEGRRLTRLSEFFGWLPVVPLLLNDVELVSGPPARRREYLDIAGAKVDRSYIRLLSGYRRSLAQYHRLLADRQTGRQLDVWETEVARTGSALATARSGIADDLLTRAGEMARGLLDSPVEFRFHCSTAGSRHLHASDDGCGVERLRARLAATRRLAAELGRVTIGPHRDDVSVRFAAPARSSPSPELRLFGSAGEQRAAATALRLAEVEYLRERTGCPVVLLMDEIAAELDMQRSTALFERAQTAGQVLYVAARPFEARGRVFFLDSGRVRRDGGPSSE